MAGAFSIHPAGVPLPADLQKKRAAIHATSLVKSGMVVGLGTGSTAGFAIASLRARIEKGEIEIVGVCTSHHTEELARDMNIPTKPLSPELKIDIYIDGADQVDPSGHMVKGGGGALLREKLVAIHASRRVIIVDETKPVPMLGGAFPLPIEIVQFGHETTIERLKKTLGIQPKLRMTGKKPFISDEGHYIVDCPFPKGIDDPRKLNVILDSIVGVVESGVFIDLCDMLIVGTKDSVRITEFERQGQRKSRGHEA